MPKHKLSEIDVKNLFAEVAFLSSNFKNFDHSIFTKRTPGSPYSPAQRLIIFRLALGLTQARFANFLDVYEGVVHQYEAGHVYRMQRKNADRFLVKIQNTYPNLHENLEIEKILKKLSQLNAIASGLENKHLLIAGKKTWFTSERGKEMVKRIPWEAKRRGGTKTAQLQKPTAQESELMKIFQIDGIPFEFHPMVKGLSRDFVADFAIPNGNNPHVVIEARRFSSRNLRVIFQGAKDMALRAFRIKKANLDIIIVGVVDIGIGIYGEPQEILQEAFDACVINQGREGLVKTLKSLLKY